MFKDYPPKVCKALVEDPQVLRDIHVCCKNILYGKFGRHFNTLKRHKCDIRCVADPNRSTRKKKKALQNGTFLEVLIKALGDAVERHDNESSENHDNDDDDNEKMRRYASTLLMLQNAKPEVKRMVIQKAGKELMNCLCECGRNILKGTVPISKAQLRDLKRYEKHLRCIDKKSVSLKRRN